MSSKQQPPGAEEPARLERPQTKKDQILALYAGGMNEVQDLALITNARPSYVAGVLHEAGKLPGYHDLYTTTAQAINVYSKFFAGKLGFRDLETSRKSVELIDHLYRQFELAGDRAGQHHALLMALTMFNRARWTNKAPEANVFRDWLVDRLREEPSVPPVEQPLARHQRTQ